MLRELMERNRPSWKESYMFSALWAATRSSCKHLQTGAVIVKDKRIIASGYNGAPPNMDNCLYRGCRKEEQGIEFEEKGSGLCMGVHAEINAMSQISRENLKGTNMYSVYSPCPPCAKAIIGNGIACVFYLKKYEEQYPLTQRMFIESTSRVEKMNLNLQDCFKMIEWIGL